MSELTLKESAALAAGYAARARSWTDIANLFDRHTYYGRSGLARRDFEELWSRREDVGYMVGGTGYQGREAVCAVLVTAKEALQKQDLENLSDLVPDFVENTPANLGAGEYELHSLVTPYIQVAGDNKTARGVWCTVGLAGHVDEQGVYQVQAVVRSCSADLVNEEDGWKLWHLRERDITAADVTGKIADQGLNAALEGRSLGARTPMASATKAQIEEQLAQGKLPGGRTGDVLRTLWDLPPAAPESNLHMTDRPQTTLLRPNRFIDDMVGPYETWDPSMSVLRSYDNP